MSNSQEETTIRGITVLQPQWPLSSRVNVCTTTRLGGVSRAPFDSFNLGLHVSDNEKQVRENRRLLGSALALPAEPVWLNQTHGTSVCDHGNPGARSFDAAWTDQRGRVLSAMTADCLPVVLAAADGSEIGVAHAGWRGLADGVLQNTVEKFSQTGRDLSAWLGPAIGPLCFEVGDDVRERFETSYSGVPQSDLHAAFVRGQDPGKWYADLYRLAGLALAELDVTRLYGGQHCTYRNRRLFYSYRRDGAQSGRMVTLAWIPERGT